METKIKYEETYAPDTDMTFIMRYTYKTAEDGEEVITEVKCVTWYYGTPDDKVSARMLEVATQNPETALTATFDK